MRPSLRLPFYATSKRLGKGAVKGAGGAPLGTATSPLPGERPAGPRAALRAHPAQDARKPCAPRGSRRREAAAMPRVEARRRAPCQALSCRGARSARERTRSRFF